MSCVYCQNYPISQLVVGNEISISGLADTMLTLQKKGAENINLVTPTHFAAQAVHAVYLARRKGLSIPIVWNSSGYESLETVKLLDGFVDIYLCDYRYATPEAAKKYSKAADYPFVVEEALEEMVRQVGIFDGRRGVIIRHLCLPGHLEETAEILRRIKEKFGPAIPISFMSQYFPAYRAPLYPEINRGLTAGEWRKAKKIFHETGLQAGWIQHDNYESV
jgi:putative pyruvate formate lyase activating enzyme